MVDREFLEYGVPDLLQVAGRAGMRAIHHPIPDYGIPRDEAKARALVMTFGLSSLEAVRRVRRARPGAIPGHIQVAFLRRWCARPI